MRRWAATCSGSATGPPAPTVTDSGVSGVEEEGEGARGQEGLLLLQGGRARMLRCWAPGAGVAAAERGPRPGHPPLAGEHLGVPGEQGQGGS